MKNPTLLVKTRILFLFTLLCAAIASVPSVHAAIFPINDGDVAALITAINTSNTNTEDDTIELATNGTYTLAVINNGVNGLPVIGSDTAHQLTIHGNGATIQRSTAGGTPNFRILHIGTGANVTIAGLTITNGYIVEFPEHGGGIYNDHATLTVTNSTLSGNFAFNDGGGIYSDHATLTVTNSTLSGNSTGSGGGIYNDHATLTVTNSTLSGNLAGYDGFGGFGGGIFNVTEFFGSATLTVTNSTFSGNSAGFGGSIANRDLGFDGGATLTIGDTILKAGASGGNIFNDSGTVISHGYNLSSDDASAFLNQTGDQNSTDPKLDANGLQDNGGPTLTIALQLDSPAINAGDPNFTPPPDYDQRGPGFDRVVNDRIDKGSFEVQSSAPCPQPQGYWKNNPDAWPVNGLTLGSQTYTKTELITILRTRIGSGPRADASLILADQLIAAKLNIENGADEPAPVPATITDADAVLSLYTGKLPYRVRPNTTNGRRMVDDANVLDSYNNGLLTAGCGG